VALRETQMLKKLKIDFHVHTGEDPKDKDIKYSAKQLLDKAAEYHFDAITIANHTSILYTDELRKYAEQRGILLIPGIEVCVEGKHVLIVNCQQSYRNSLNFKNVRSYAGENALIIAPHPFYPREYCLGETLEENIEVFDAIEYAHLHFRFVNFNNKAVALAQKYDLPLVGTSDAHTLQQLNTTYSLVEAQKTVPAIINAVKNKRVEIVTQPMSTWKLFKEGSGFLISSTKKFIRRALSPKP
jgi:predicted metal-dependent phosphoesterase TrpH